MGYYKFYILSFVVFFCALISVHEPLLDAGDQYIAQLAYDDNGNRSQLEYYLEGDYNGDYATIDYTYNRDNYLTGYNTTPYGTAGDPCFCLYNVTLDGLGQLTAATEILTKIDDSDVTHSHTYSYDMLSQLTSASITNIGGSTWTAGYDYRKDGNIDSRTINGDPCDYEYDGDLMTEAEGQDLDWDLNGNLTAGISSSLIYNWDNKLQSATRGSNSIALKYDPDDNRVWKKTTNSQNVTYRKYIVAEIDSLPVILLEIDPCDSTIKKSYVYAGDQIIMQHDGGMNADKYFYLHDRLGSVRQVIDVNASVEHLYTYGPFGKKLEADDDDPCAPGNPFQFTGLYFDYEIDQHHARARQLSTELFRFTSRDPVVGNFNEPLTLHAYLYCLNDPINRTDISGEYSKEEVTTTSSIGGGMGAAGGSQAGNILQRARDFADMMSQRNWLYGQTIANLGDRVGQWTKAMNRMDMQIHHIVGKGWGNVATYGKEMINSFNNLIAIDPTSHSKITAFFNSGQRLNLFMGKSNIYKGFRTLQEYVSQLPFDKQFMWGQSVLIHLATHGTLSNFEPAFYGLL